ncbi:MAG: glutaminyl-peptide cyclotransferase [Bryobacteraceae bacterium]|nr:glutaminyl-peptide cyclotransferase [Bryobacteraceae bacterium]MDW8378343.1 glutaminyl-peptide cyclotransferase [Bryobacterales bacterium]
MGRYLLLAFSLGWLASCSHSPAQQSAPEYGIRVVHVYPHDRNAFTQGLEYHEGVLYESTGLEGRSGIRRVELETGRVLDFKPLAEFMFGEGITVLNGEIFQLTWRHQTGFVYRQSDFALLRRFQYPGEGWGLANDGKFLYMSDGTDEIRVWEPPALTEVRRIRVHDGQRNIRLLNELEWVDGEIFANVWQTNRIVRISPEDGRVTGWIDLEGLLTADDLAEPVDVLNGIAYDAATGRLFVTGKLWPKLFEIVPVKR